MPKHHASLFRGALLFISIALPTALFAQGTLPIETRELKMQGSTSGTISLTVPATVGTPYTLTLPSAAPGNGSLIYSNTTTGGLAWSNTPSATGWSLRWNGTALEWFDPAGSSNPNWAIGGNTLTATASIGATSNFGISIITNNLERMSISNAGVIGINDGTNAGATTNIGKSANTVNILGVTNINNAGSDATNIGTGATAGTIAIGRTGGAINTTGTLTQTGTLNLAGTASPLQMQGSAGTTGDVLVSQGTGATPAWQSISSAVGIRKAGQAAVTAATSATVTGLTTLTGTDAIIVTLEGSTSVTATVTSRTAGTGFTVTFSGQYTGTVNYMVIAAI
ncbi:MAG: hypothetical protein RIR53_1890 [Bacteroidota bacterium]|jgi:hypothetical protein